MQIKKILNKQAVIILLAIIILFASKFIPITSSNFFIEDLLTDNKLYKISYWSLGIFGVLTIIRYTLIKKGKDLGLINIAFRTLSYIFSFGLLLIFIFFFLNIFYLENHTGVSFLTNLWHSISFRFSSTYLSTGEYFSIWQDFSEFLVITPYLISSILLYLGARLNKKLK